MVISAMGKDKVLHSRIANVERSSLGMKLGQLTRVDCSFVRTRSWLYLARICMHVLSLHLPSWLAVGEDMVLSTALRSLVRLKNFSITSGGLAHLRLWVSVVNGNCQLRNQPVLVLAVSTTAFHSSSRWSVAVRILHSHDTPMAHTLTAAT